MISTILSLSFTNSTATNAKPPAFALCASWLMLLASPTSLRIASASCLFSRGMTSAEITACRTYSLMRTPASPALFDGILEIATNGSGFLCGEQSKVVSVYRNITLLSL